MLPQFAKPSSRLKTNSFYSFFDKKLRVLGFSGLCQGRYGILKRYHSKLSAQRKILNLISSSEPLNCCINCISSTIKLLQISLTGLKFNLNIVFRLSGCLFFAVMSFKLSEHVLKIFWKTIFDVCRVLLDGIDLDLVENGDVHICNGFSNIRF